MRSAKATEVKATALCVAAGALLSACAVGPDYKRPEIESPKDWRIEDPKAAEVANTRWWEQFGDPALNQLIEESLQGNLDVQAEFFQAGDAPKLVYCPHSVAAALRSSLGDVATVVATGAETVSPAGVLADLFARGARTLLIEGGTAINTLFLSAGLVDELRLAVAPFLVGEDGAPRLVSAGRFPHDSKHRMKLTKVERLGDMAVLWYLLGAGSPSS